MTASSITRLKAELSRAKYLVLMSLAAFGSAGDSLLADGSPAIVTGTFLQLTRDNASRGQLHWDRELDAMKAIGMDTLVVQYVASNSRYFYPTRIAGARPNEIDTIESLLDGAQRRGIQVLLGLHLDTSFWRGRFDQQSRLRQNHAVLKELHERYGDAPALAGWYIPEEIDDHSAEREYAEPLLEYIALIAGQARRLSGLPVMISPFFGSNPDADSYARWWDEVALPIVDVDIVAMQDGVGTHRTSIEESRKVFAAVAPVMKRHNVAFWANNECFNQTQGWPIDDRRWLAQPAKASTFIQQVHSTAPFVEKSIVFEFHHYLNPAASRRAKVLYQAYRGYHEDELRRVPASPHPH